MNMRNPAAPVCFDVRSQTTANYARVLGVPVDELQIYTVLSEEWSAHLERASGIESMKRTAVAPQSGATTEEALWKLYIASAKATQGHLQNCRTNSVRSTSIDPPALGGDVVEDCNCHDNGDESDNEDFDDESETATRIQTAEVDIQVPEVEQGLRRHHPTSGVIGMGPFSSTLDNPRHITVRIRVSFDNIEPFDMVERISPTQDGVLEAAMNHCDALTDNNHLRACLQSVTVGKNTLGVHGRVSDLVALIGALPRSDGFPIFDVEVTEVPDT